MRKKKIGKMTYSVAQHFDLDAIPKEDFKETRLNLQVPIYFKKELESFAVQNYGSMKDCVMDAVIKLMSGFDYIYAAKHTAEETIHEEIKTYAAALVNTVRDLTANLEQYAVPLRAAATATTQLKDSLTEQIHAELQRRKEDAKILAIRIIYLQPNHTPEEIISSLSETLALPEIFASQVIQGLLDVDLIRLEGETLHPSPL